MVKRVLVVAAVAFVGALPAATVVHAQQADPITASVRGVHEIVRGYITRSAEQFPEDQYGFQPTKEVRTFGQLLGHIANANYAICGTATGQKGPGVDVEQTATTKAQLQKALAESFAFCDQAYATMTDAKGAEMVKLFGREQARIGALAFNNAHNFEHYGNLVTYLRLKGMVPPSTAGMK